MDKHNDSNELTPRDRAFEQELKTVLHRVEAPRALSVALMNLAEAETAREATAKAAHKRSILSAFRIPPRWFGGAVAAVLAIGCFSLEAFHVHHQHERAEATRQFDIAQQITDRTLDQTRERLERKGISLYGN